MKIIDTAAELVKMTDGNICNNCLGRCLSKTVEGKDNQARGEYLRKILEESHRNTVQNSECQICQDILKDLDLYVDKAIEYLILEKIHFETFLIGCKMDPEIIVMEEEVHKKLDLDAESIKKEINREVGKKLSARLSKEVEFNSPDVVLTIDLKNGGFDAQINPIFIESRYRKLVRGIPQTKWPCSKCKGRGCESCNFTGKMYPETVEELISEEAIKAANGSGAKFHGAGREDIDVRMLGNGRTFVLEIKEPRIRDIDLLKLVDKVNDHAKGRVEISEMKFVPKSRKAEIKESSRDTYKVYRAIVELDEEVEDYLLGSLESLKVIDQRTPIRVSHRRADKVRTRKIRNIKYKKLDKQTLELIIECEGGLYIKELISSDDCRSKPSVAEILKTGARCVQLDVLEVNL